MPNCCWRRCDAADSPSSACASKAQGAVDYVLKDNRARLVPAIERALKEADDREARRLALRQLEASEERFRSISEATQEWIWETDSQGLYTFSSPAVETMIGYKPQEILGKNCLDLVSPTLRPQLARLLRRGTIERTDGGMWCCICGTRLALYAGWNKVRYRC